ncbi:MAG: ammonia-forming cytochrome c nitrite reductase subunit c552 [SAR324 cluster bacterium]|nr:ammonia-forming cytochrome c nitrite reductase subunit c552 [SAR324 cluster bacterium]
MNVAFLVGTGGLAFAKKVENSCVDCHSDSDFLVTNKKLYNYFQQWTSSTHNQEEVTCTDCHGGNQEEADKKLAHGKDIDSNVRFANVPDTCGTCHDDIYNGYRKSPHFENLTKKKDGHQGPNCVTCHGSLNVAALNVNTVKKTCVQCHNEKTKNNPEIPDKAENLLNQFLSIHRFYRYISLRGEPTDTKSFLTGIDGQLEDLSTTWHTFDLKNIATKTRTVLDSLSAKRDEVRKQMKSRQK